METNREKALYLQMRNVVILNSKCVSASNGRLLQGTSWDLQYIGISIHKKLVHIIKLLGSSTDYPVFQIAMSHNLRTYLGLDLASYRLKFSHLVTRWKPHRPLSSSLSGLYCCQPRALVVYASRTHHSRPTVQV